MDPDQTPSPNPSGEEPSPASGTPSQAADSTFVADPGAPFDPEAAGEPPELEREPSPGELHALPGLEGWEQDAIEGVLTGQGALLHAIAGVGEQDWLYTEADLAAIAPPLTRILNRYPATRAAAGTGDELALMFGLGAYTTRSWAERRAVLAELEAEEPVPLTGDRPADPQPSPAGPDDGSWRTR